MGLITKTCLGAVLWTAASAAAAHARLDPNGSLKPRSNSSSLKTGGDCGAVAPTTNDSTRTVLQAGTQFEVTWQETISHPGWFRLAFSPDGETGFDQNVLLDHYDQKAAAESGIGSSNPDNPDPAHTRVHKGTITVPDTECTHCSIQLIQIMSDSTSRIYHSCADIRIVKGAVTSGTTPPAPQNLGVKVKYLSSP